MRTRRLGSQGPAVSAIGLGCIGMTTGFYGEADENQVLDTLNRALDAGCGFWDSSDAYGPYTNEMLLAKVLATRRDEIFIATKFGIKFNPETMQRSIDGKPESVRTSCDASLLRLGVDHIDLYFQHRVDPSTPIEETVGAMAELVHQGKVRFLGLCEAGPDTIRRAQAVHPLAAVQTEYSIWSRDVEREVLPTLRSLDVALVAYAPLGRGFLTGNYASPDQLGAKDVRRSLPRFSGENLTHNVELVTALRRLAAERNITPAQLGLAWLLNQGFDIVPIPGTSRATHLDENLAAVDIQLDAADLAAIEAAVPAPAGDRYDPSGMRTVNT